MAAICSHILALILLHNSQMQQKGETFSSKAKHAIKEGLEIK